MKHAWTTFALGLGIAAVISPPSPVHADTETLTPIKDNTLFSTDPVTSNGAGIFMFSGRTGDRAQGIRQRAVLAFDVASNIPPGSTITSASLTLTLLQAAPDSGDQTHTLHRILADWGEGTSFWLGGTGAPATDGDATWLHTFFPDQSWGNEGGDFDATTSASQTVSVSLGPFTWGSSSQMVADVQGWLDDPSTNFGWLLKGNEDDLMTAKKFASRESVADPPPMLSIEFTIGCEDDGAFCNGDEVSDPVLGCTSTGDPCQPGQFCNEETDICDDCLDGSDCDDAIACTDHGCVDGSCVFTPNNANCPDDGLFCNGTESCHLLLDCVHSSDACPAEQTCNEETDTCDGCDEASDCDDGVDCTDDTCETGSCLSTPNNENCLDDGLFCNGTESCVLLLDCVSSGDPCPPGQSCDEDSDTCEACTDDNDCDDGVACTDDSCTAGNCVSEPNDAHCSDDGLFCNGTESCNAAADCVHSGSPCQTGEICNENSDTCEACTDDSDCDDSVGCTDDGCVAGSCVFTPNNANCLDDGLFCNGTESCNPLLDCVSSGSPCQPGELCNEDTDTCHACTNDSECDDGVFCNGAETCNTLTGLCALGGDPCPSQLCAEDSATCVDCLADTDCDDGAFCNGAETCATQTGTCAAGDDPCPAQVCDEASDACVACLVDTDCDDGLFCNGAETCAGLACGLGTNPCTENETCDEEEDICEPAGENDNGDGEPNEPAQLADDDGDNVLNEVDLCPDTPAGETVDDAGCSESQAAEQEQPDGCGSDTCASGSTMSLGLTLIALRAMRTSRRRRKRSSH